MYAGYMSALLLSVVFLSFYILLSYNVTFHFYSVATSKTHTTQTQVKTKDFLVGVFTTCDSSLRQITRTWLNNFKDPTLMTARFLLDYDEECIAKLKPEQSKYQDLVFLKTKKQGYVNLIHKTLAFYQYAAKQDNYKYVVKTDDDAVVMWDKLAEILKQKSHDRNIYFGFMKTTPVHLEGRWASPKYHEDTGLQNYPLFAHGAMYGVSLNATKALSKINEIQELPLWETEDTSVGHWMTMLSVERVHIPHYAEVGSYCGADRIVIHPFKDPNNLQNFIENYKTNVTTACSYFT
jgi:hypothetical protein